MYADYEFYTNSFFGKDIEQADFPRFASRASDFIDYYTRGKAEKVTDDKTQVALAKACCAIAEAMQTDATNKAIAAKSQAAALSASTGEIKSETVGSWSASYTTAADYTAQSAKGAQAAINALYAAIAFEYLANTGLLYRGGCCR